MGIMAKKCWFFYRGHRFKYERLIEKTAIENQVAIGEQIGRDRWRMPKPALDEALHRTDALTTLGGSLSQRVAFDNPALWTMLFLPSKHPHC
jgi:hypothetical protein